MCACLSVCMYMYVFVSVSMSAVCLSVCLKYLVERGADLEIANRHGHTCLMIACYKGHIAIVRYLLDRGADVRRKSLKGINDMSDSAVCSCCLIDLYE